MSFYKIRMNIDFTTVKIILVSTVLQKCVSAVEIFDRTVFSYNIQQTFNL